MPYLHLPVQSGLGPHPRGDEPPARTRSLPRRWSIACATARADLALSSDFIVGFPGESDADFDDTMRLVDQVGFASAFSFRYSRRPGTPGSAMPDQVPEAVKSPPGSPPCRRCSAGRRATSTISKVGATVPVLFAETGRKPGQIIGKTPWLQSGLRRAAIRG